MVSNPDRDGTPKRIEFPVPDYTTGLIAYQTLVTLSMAKRDARRWASSGC